MTKNACVQFTVFVLLIMITLSFNDCAIFFFYLATPFWYTGE